MSERAVIEGIRPQLDVIRAGARESETNGVVYTPISITFVQFSIPHSGIPDLEDGRQEGTKSRAIPERHAHAEIRHRKTEGQPTEAPEHPEDGIHGSGVGCSVGKFSDAGRERVPRRL